jgi:hypothetical protein
MSALSPAKWISDQELFVKFGYRKAIEAISHALTGGFDPATDKPRSFVEFASGQGLVMPSENAEFVGLKFVTVAPTRLKTFPESKASTRYLMPKLSLLSPSVMAPP